MIEAGSLAADGSPAGAAPLSLRVLRVGAPVLPVPDGIIERPWRGVDIDLPAAAASRPLEAIAAGTARIDPAPIAWADAIVFAPPFRTVPVCLDCGFTEPDRAEPIEHARAAGHTWRRARDQLVRGLVLAGARDPGLWLARGLVVELRGDPMAEAPDIERDLVRALFEAVDVVVAATPDAADAARREGVPEERLVRAGVGPAGDAARAAALWRAAAAHDGARLERRLALRAADAEHARRLAGRRAGDQPAPGPGGPGVQAGASPLVSVVLAVVDEPPAVVERAIAAALACDGVRLEVVVAGPAGSAADPPAGAAEDPRVRRVRGAPGSRASSLAAGLDAAAGAWIAPLDPRSAPLAHGPATLLAVATEYGLDVVYAQAILVADGDPVGVQGAWPATRGTFVPDALLFDAGLRAFRPDPDAAADGDEPCWNLWLRWSEAGCRLASIDEPLALREIGGEVPANAVTAR